jgi:hypothetical protein
LTSPEKNDLVQYVEHSEFVEDREYEQIAENLRAGKAVYRIDTFYRIAGANITRFEETEKSQVNPSDFGVD